MSEQSPERLDGNVSLTVALDQSGITASAKGRTFVAIDRLIGASVDIFATTVEGVRDRAQIRAQAKTITLAAETATFLAGAEGVPDLTRRALEHLVADETRKQENREAVAIRALEQLRLPPPSDTTNADTSADHATLDQDWLNVFSRHAEGATSERFQSLWGRILAGEIRKPTSFSLTTLRVLAEMDSEVANSFEAIIPDLIGDTLPLTAPLSGPFLEQMELLLASGLINGTPSRRVELLEFEPGKVSYRGHEYVLEISLRSGMRSTSVSVWALTRPGRELARMIGRSEIKAMKRVAPFIQGATKAEIHRLLSQSGGIARTDFVEEVAL